MLTLDILETEIADRDLSWKAELNPVAERIDRQAPRAGLFGLEISEDERATLLVDASRAHRAKFAAPAAPPPAVDWRDKSAQNWVTPVKDQGNCGSCVSFATCAVLETRAKIEINDASHDIDLSEAHLFFCGAGRACRSGWNFVPALTYCRAQGVGAEIHFPYSDHDQGCRVVAPIVRVNDWETAALMADRKQAVAKGPVLAGMKIFEDFSLYGDGIYQHTLGAFQGLHAVAVVGYSDSDRCWIVKNSWGSGWGEDGFFRIRYGECGMDTEFVFFVPEIQYPIVPTSPVSVT